MLRQPKISNFQFSIGSDKYILCFDVSVYNIFFVKLFDSFNKGFENGPKLLLCVVLLYFKPSLQFLNKKYFTFERSPFSANSVTMYRFYIDRNEL